jgi:hypothetical protein
MNDLVKVKIKWNDDGREDEHYAYANYEGKAILEEEGDDLEIFYFFEVGEEVVGKHMEFEVLEMKRMEKVFCADFGSTTITESELNKIETREDFEQWKVDTVSYVDVDTSVFSHWEEVDDVKE